MARHVSKHASWIVSGDHCAAARLVAATPRVNADVEAEGTPGEPSHLATARAPSRADAEFDDPEGLSWNGGTTLVMAVKELRKERFLRLWG